MNCRVWGRVCICLACLGSPVLGQNFNESTFPVDRQDFERNVANLKEFEIERFVEPADDGSSVSGFVNRAGKIVVRGHGQEAAGLDFQSTGGHLVPVTGEPPSAAPFTFLLSNTKEQVTFGSLGQTVTLDGSLVTGVGFSGDDPENQMTASWGDGASPVAFPVLPMVRQVETITSAFNLQEDGTPVQYDRAIYHATIEAGSLTGSPPDSPANRVDPNTTTSRFAGVGSLEVVHPTLGTFVCTGTVIDDTHVLTAGHCFDLDNDGAVDAGTTAGSQFRLNAGGSPSATLAISAVDIHPDFGGFATSGANDDLAVVTLSSAVPTGTTKYAIRAAGMTAAEVIEMVGYGVSGHGDVGGFEVFPDLSVKRSGENEVDLFVVDDEGSGRDEIYMYDFDGPTGTGFLGGGSIGNDRETVVRAGDSGGPAFVDVSGVPVLAGVNTFEFTLEGTTPPTGEFGVLGGGVILDSPQFDWIKSIAPGATRAVPEPDSLLLVCLSLLVVSVCRRPRRGNGV